MVLSTGILHSFRPASHLNRLMSHILPCSVGCIVCYSWLWLDSGVSYITRFAVLSVFQNTICCNRRTKLAKAHFPWTRLDHFILVLLALLAACLSRSQTGSSLWVPCQLNGIGRKFMRISLGTEVHKFLVMMTMAMSRVLPLCPLFTKGAFPVRDEGMRWYVCCLYRCSARFGTMSRGKEGKYPCS